MINPNFKSNGSYRILAKDLKVSNDPFVTGLNNHDLIIGSTCSGKTGSYVTPNILVADSSMVVVDTKITTSSILNSWKHDFELISRVLNLHRKEAKAHERTIYSTL